MSEQLVVVGDVHGQVPIIEAVRDRYQNVDRVIFAGDVVDGSNVMGTLETIRSLEATVVLGNHEQYLLGAMLESDEDQRRDLVYMWSRVHRGTLGSYGLYLNPTPAAALQLRDRMDQRGHLELLQTAPLYFENQDMVVIHGDVTSEPWPQQRAVLETEKQRNLAGHYWGWDSGHMMPPQMGGEQRQVTPANLVASGLTKLLLSGHFHLPNRDTSGRYLNNGQHILLAGDPLHGFTYAYESWTGRLHLVESS